MNRLKEIRKEFQLTQAELGQKIGKSQTTVCDMEKGRHSIERTTALAVEAVLGVNANWLLTGEGPKYKNRQTGRLSSHPYFPVQEGTPLPVTDHIQPEDGFKELFIQWFNNFWEQASQEQRIWLKVELQEKVPKFAEWLQKKDQSPNGDDPPFGYID